MTENDWKRLLRQIRGGYVVPVLGPQLLAGLDGASTVQRRVATRLLEQHRIEPPELLPFRELNTAVSAILEQERGRSTAQDLYTDVYDLLDEAVREQDAVPEPIRQLADISDFKLFVTMTGDSMLADCLRRRRRVQEIVHAPKLPSSEWRDLAPAWSEQPAEANVLYLFGKARPAPLYAIHDEDVLEYAHNVISRGSNVPVNFVNALQERSLLLLGCGLSDWLGRFFLRLINKDRLSEKARREWLIEPVQAGDGLTSFVRIFSSGTEFHSGIPPAAFVAELHRRWLLERQADAAGPVQGETWIPPTGSLFFISYSRLTDMAKAEAMVRSLMDLGVAENEIWFDRRAIEPGEEFGQEILEGIRNCRYFLPLLSEAAMAREEAFVFREWRAANYRRQSMQRRFVIPVIVDEDYEPSRCIASSAVVDWNGLDFGFAPGGSPDE
jgi:hypothetical protein